MVELPVGPHGYLAFGRAQRLLSVHGQAPPPPPLCAVAAQPVNGYSGVDRRWRFKPHSQNHHKHLRP